MTNDLIERLLKTPLYEASGEESDLPYEAAVRIRELEAENEALQEALKFYAYVDTSEVIRKKLPHMIEAEADEEFDGVSQDEILALAQNWK